VVIIDTTGHPRPIVIGQVDLFAAPVLVHDQAIYIHESRQYHVDHLDWDERKAYVTPVDVDYYTQALLAVTLKPLETFASAPALAAERAHGEVMVSSIATLFKKLRLETHENLGWGKIHLPEIELHTTSYWVALGAQFDPWRRDELDVALAGAGRAMQTVASVLLMADPHDIGMVAQVRSPHQEKPVVYLYDSVPGGVGLAGRLYDRHEELVASALGLVEACGCNEGCPACVGPRIEANGLAKQWALRLLRELVTR
jgi:DEAD/DEAH box helicase domain-containing protein